MRKRPFYQTKKFKSLEKIWQKRLRASGFKDIETHQGQVQNDLEDRVGFRFGIKEITENYFSWARGMLFVARFKKRAHRQIWKAHSEGKSAAEIGREVNLTRFQVYSELKEIKEYLKKLDT